MANKVIVNPTEDITVIIEEAPKTQVIVEKSQTLQVVVAAPPTINVTVEETPDVKVVIEKTPSLEVFPVAAPVLLQGYSGYSGFAGVSGYSGLKGESGSTGLPGYSGWSGAGVPSGGTSGQVLIKNSAYDYQTVWMDARGLSGASVRVQPDPPDTPPPQEGDLWWDSVEGQLKIYYADADSGQWVEAVNVGVGLTGDSGISGYSGTAGGDATILVEPDFLTPPPVVGQLWFDTDEPTSVTGIGPAGPAGSTGYSGISGYSGKDPAIPVQTNPPSSLILGHLWFDTDEPTSVVGSGYSGYSGLSVGSATFGTVISSTSGYSGQLKYDTNTLYINVDGVSGWLAFAGIPVV